MLRWHLHFNLTGSLALVTGVSRGLAAAGAGAIGMPPSFRDRRSLARLGNRTWHTAHLLKRTVMPCRR
jgi:hypothetical protein